MRVACVLAKGPLCDAIRLFRASERTFEIEIVHDAAELSDFDVEIFVCPVEILPYFLDHAGGKPVLAYGASSFLPHALSIGAVDYLKNPWDVDEYFARISLLTNRVDFDLSWGKVTLRSGVPSVNGLPLEVCNGAEQLFRNLLRRIGRPVPRQSLLQILGIRNMGSRVVDVYISVLRSSIQTITAIPGTRIIVTHKNSGYELMP